MCGILERWVNFVTFSDEWTCLADARAVSPRPATTLTSTRAVGAASSVQPIAVQAGQGSERNSSRTFMITPRWSCVSTWLAGAFADVLVAFSRSASTSPMP